MRFLLFIALIFSAVYADEVMEKVRSLVSPQSFLINRGKFEIDFQRKNDFYLSPDRVDSVKIAAELKKNGFLEIFYRSPERLQATFRTRDYPIFFLKAVSESVKALSYNYTPISAMRSDANYFEWTLSYKSQSAIDPVLLAEALKKYNIAIEDISMSGSGWFYLLASDEPKIPEAFDLNATHTIDAPLQLKNIYGEYWIKLPKYADRIGIRKATNGSWVVYAVFYDSGLQPIQTATAALRASAQTPNPQFLSPMPENAAYMKISDDDVADILRRGLNAWVEIDAPLETEPIEGLFYDRDNQ